MTSIKPFGLNWPALVAKDNDWGVELPYPIDPPVCEVLPPLPISDSEPPPSIIRRMFSYGKTQA